MRNVTPSEAKSIWPPYEVLYIRSMRLASSSAIESIVNINTAFEEISKRFPENPLSAVPTAPLLSELQNIVAQAATISRYFWPVRKAHEWRGEILRKAFDVSEASPLRSRDLRNELEHFDEKLDLFLENAPIGYFIPEYIGLANETTIDNPPEHMFRAYFVNTGVFELLGKRYQIPDLTNEIVRIHELLTYAERSGGRLPRKAA